MSDRSLLPSSSMKLHGKRVLVIGGTSGIGFAVACASYDNGAQVIVSSSSATKVAHAVDRFVCDLSNATTVEDNLRVLLDEATEDTPLDHIAVTAGNTLNIKPLSDITIELIQSSGVIRFVAPLILAKLICQRKQEHDQNPYIRPSPDSSITFTTGTANNKPEGPGWAIVSGYAAGLEGSIRAMVLDLKPIRVNAVSPGAIETELYAAASDERIDQLKRESMTGRLGRPSDIAEAYLYCMRDRFFTGKALQSDGGRLLH